MLTSFEAVLIFVDAPLFLKEKETSTKSKKEDQSQPYFNVARVITYM